jgi:prolyl oligopeptidase
VQSFQTFGGRAFYLYRAPGADAFDLVVREHGRTRKLVDIAALAASAGTNLAINYFAPSPDGARVALGISANGSENASLTVLDVASGRTIAGPVARAVFAGVSWVADGRGLFFNRLAEPVDGRDPYLGSSANYWDLGHEAVPLALPVEVEPQAFPYVDQWAGASQAALVINNGVQFECEIWLAPRAMVAKPGARWRRLTTRADAVTAIDMSGDRIFLLSHRGAPTYQVLALHAGETLADAAVVVPADPRRVIESIHAARDALYVVSRDGVYSHLIRVPLDGGAAREIALPFAGDLTEVSTTSAQPGVSFMLQSWVVPPTAMHYDPARAKLTSLALGHSPEFDPTIYRVSGFEAPAKDAVRVPLTLVQQGDDGRAAPTLLYGYGSYGLSTLPQFRAYQIPLMAHGVTSAFCHVRGGGELGEAWHLAGKGANKPNSWRDLIACAEFLVARGVTTPKLLFLRGGSAGGTLVARAMEERPDLFAGVIAQVPDTNLVRIDVQPGGAANFPEVGSPKDPLGFENLLMGDAFHHVERGVQYPPIMITTGLNDTRVAPWLPAKFAAKLQASDTRAPVLLRVDESSGHGQGFTRSQLDELFIDIGAFMFWQSGYEDWQPRTR